MGDKKKEVKRDLRCETDKAETVRKEEIDSKKMEGRGNEEIRRLYFHHSHILSCLFQFFYCLLLIATDLDLYYVNISVCGSMCGVFSLVFSVDLYTG